MDNNDAALWGLQQATALGLPIPRHSNTEAMLASLAPGMQVTGQTVDYFIRETATNRQADQVQTKDSTFFASVLSARNAATLFAAHPPPPADQTLLFGVCFEAAERTHWMLVFVTDNFVLLYDAGLKEHEERRKTVFKAVKRYMEHFRPGTEFSRIDVRLPGTRQTLVDSGVWVLAAADWIFAGQPMQELQFADLSAHSARHQLARNLLRMTNGRWHAYAPLKPNGELQPVAPLSPPPQVNSDAQRLRKIKKEVAEGVVCCRKQAKHGCPNCPRRFRTHIRLAQHRRTHTVFKYRCSCCQSHAKTAQNRNKHERAVHKLKRPHDYLFDEGPLPHEVLTRLQHTIQHSFKCECGIVFDNRNKLDTHLREFGNVHLLPRPQREAQASEQEQEQPMEHQPPQEQQREPSEHLPSVNGSPQNTRDAHSPLSAFNSPFASSLDRSRCRSMSVLPNAANGPLVVMLKPANKLTERVETMRTSEITIFDYELMKAQYGWTPIEFWLESPMAELLVLRLATPQWEQADPALPAVFLSVPHQRYELPRSAGRQCHLVFYVKQEVAHKYASLRARLEADPSISLPELVVSGIRELPIRRAVLIVTELMRQLIRDKAAEAVGIL
ncbi:hypothetical protein M3Y99_00896600 [Aphelenchoides fujianensis]|nr:hypothetical protein M3Y99_00896600 [Aphelenchoides fujianensis]